LTAKFSISGGNHLIRLQTKNMFYDYRKMPDYQGSPNITEDTKCWGIVICYESNDGQFLNGKEDWLETFRNLTFADAEQKAEQLNKQLKDNT
jgi:hypothetical protein